MNRNVVRRSHFDGGPVVVLGPGVPIGLVVHVFTDAELRARDERMIRAAIEEYGGHDAWRAVTCFGPGRIDAIIAEADQ